MNSQTDSVTKATIWWLLRLYECPLTSLIARLTSATQTA